MGFTNGARALFEPIREVVFGDIGANYSVLGTPYENPMRIIMVVNTTNAAVFISFDGVTDHMVIPAGTFRPYNFGANQAEPAGLLAQSQNTQPWVKLVSAAATSGSVYLESVYAAGANG